MMSCEEIFRFLAAFYPFATSLLGGGKFYEPNVSNINHSLEGHKDCHERVFGYHKKK